jgi:hypothetical protein
MITDKPKRKRKSHSDLTYWWNEFLFTRRFEFETTLPPEDCAERLRGLKGKVGGFWYQYWSSYLRIAAEVDDSGPDIHFRIRTRRGTGGGVTISEAVGDTLTDDINGAVMVSGESKFGRLFYTLMILGLVIGLMFMWSSVNYTPLPLLAFAIYWWWFYRDRNRLIRLIGEALDDTKAKRNEGEQ